MNNTKFRWSIFVIYSLVALVSGCMSPDTGTSLGDETLLTATHEYIDTPVSQPTRSQDESQTSLIRLLADNAMCQVPCLFGIVPGKTTANKALDFFENNGWTIFIDGGFHNLYKGFPGIALTTGGGIQSDNLGDHVEGMYLFVSGDAFVELVRYFSIRNMIDVLGPSVEVRLYLVIEPNGYQPEETAYELYLYSPDKGVLLAYPGTARKEDDSYVICPAKPHQDSTNVSTESGTVSVFVKEPIKEYTPRELALPFREILGYQFYKPIDLVLGINVAQFRSELMENDRACFRSLIELWDE